MPQMSEGKSPLAERGEKQPLKKGAREGNVDQKSSYNRMGKDYIVESTGQTQLRSS
jgi:hypothetical protein